MEITLDGDIRRVSKLLIDGVDSKKATNVVYSSLDKERPPHSVTYKHNKTILEMAKKRLVKILNNKSHFHPSSTTTINEYPYYEISYQPSVINESLAEVVKTINPVKDNDVLSWKKLKINTSQGTLQYNNRPPFEIEIGIKEFKLLIHLMRYRKINSYVELAKHLGLEEKGEELEANADTARDVQFVMRDLKNLLKQEKIPNDFIKSMFVTKYKIGYKLADE